MKELGAKSPLIEAGLTKADIRGLSKKRRLPTWNKPSAACLASRNTVRRDDHQGEALTHRKGEAWLASLGFSTSRLRHHGALARIEVPAGEIARLASGALRSKIVAKMKALGFRYVTFDLEGYRSGSMNEAASGGRGRTRAARKHP